MNIKLHKNDLPDDLELGNLIAVDGEFMGLNIRRDPLCLIQISTGNSDAHIVQLDRKSYNAPNLVRILKNARSNSTLVFKNFKHCLYNSILFSLTKILFNSS